MRNQLSKILYILPIDSNKHLQFIIYYKKFKTINHIITNNSLPQKTPLCGTNVVNQLSCSLRDCISNTNDKKYLIHTLGIQSTPSLVD